MIIPRDVPTVEDFLKKLFGNLEALEEEIQHYPDARSLALLLGARLKVYELVYAHLPQSLAANVCGNDLATKIVSSILSKTKEEIVGEGVEYDDEDNNSDERTPNLGDEAKSSGDNELVLHEGTTEEILT